MSILFLYLRIFPSKGFRLATHITIACIIAQTIAFCLVASFQCIPVDSYWDTTIPGTCIHSQAFVYSAAGVSILEDLIIMFLPVMELRALNLDLKKKFALGFMFALGSL
jgi:chloramphenicol 3-O-phosphotransferase